MFFVIYNAELTFIYTGGQKFGILTLISLSLKNKYKNKYKKHMSSKV